MAKRKYTRKTKKPPTSQAPPKEKKPRPPRDEPRPPKVPQVKDAAYREKYKNYKGRITYPQNDPPLPAWSKTFLEREWAELTIKQRAFLCAYAMCGNMARAARESGVSRVSHPVWRDKNELYRKAFKKAHDEAADRLEEEARRRAVEGIKKLKFFKGEPIIDPDTGQPYFEHEYSDILLMFLLKGVRPQKFRDSNHFVKTENQHTHAHVHGKIGEWLDELSIESRRKMLDILRLEKERGHPLTLPPPDNNGEGELEEVIPTEIFDHEQENHQGGSNGQLRPSE